MPETLSQDRRAAERGGGEMGRGERGRQRGWGRGREEKTNQNKW